MLPILIKIGPLTIHTYGLLMVFAVFAAFFLILKLSKRQNMDQRLLFDFLFYTLIIGLLGAKLFLFVTEFKFYSENPGEIKNLITSAGTFYGGLICGGLFAVWFLRKHKLDYREVADMVGPAIALAHFFGRLGCFFAGCCWGREAENCSIAVTFNDTSSSTGVPLNIPLYPTQLMEAFLNLLNFALLMLLYRRKKFPGQIFAIYVFNYSLIRFFVEFFRGDYDRGYIFGSLEHPFSSLSVPQLISIIGIITAVILYKFFKKKSAGTVESPAASAPPKKKKKVH